jgi:membrane dipeptidase
VTDLYVVDGHNDLPWALRELGAGDLAAVDLAAGAPALHTDLPRLTAGGVGAQFWSVWVPGDLAPQAAVATTLEQVDLVHRMVRRHPDRLAMAGTADDIEAVVASGRIACLMGMEGGHQIGGSLAVLRMMHTLGVRYLTLTHERNVEWADSATDEPAAHGLTEFGREVVRELNRIGMFCDLSHVSADVMRDALAVSTAPVIFSHSGARAVCDNPRNVPDDVLRALADGGGVCMVTFLSRIISPAVSAWWDEARTRPGGALEARRTDPPPPCPVALVADHVDHVREVAGPEHVGLGGDYDGTPWLPEDMPDVSSYPVLLEELRRRGWNESELALLTHANLLRAMRAMEDASNPGPTAR